MYTNRYSASKLAVLSRIGIFRALPEEALAVLSRSGQRRRFRAGRTLIRQGEIGTTMHVIVKGRVTVQRSHPALAETLVLAEFGPGEVVGELAVLDREPRSATVTAICSTETVELSDAALADTVLRYPAASG